MRISMSSLAALVLVTLLVGSAHAERASWHDLDGKAAPALQVDAWLNAGTSAGTLEGRVWLIGFFALH